MGIMEFLNDNSPSRRPASATPRRRYDCHIFASLVLPRDVAKVKVDFGKRERKPHPKMDASRLHCSIAQTFFMQYFDQGGRFGLFEHFNGTLKRLPKRTIIGISCHRVPSMRSDNKMLFI